MVDRLGQSRCLTLPYSLKSRLPGQAGAGAGSTRWGCPTLSTIGETLRSAREARGQSIQEVAAATRIRPAYLEALEEERFDAIGGDVYARGFLRTYAGFLGLDPAPLVEAYRAGRPPPAPVFANAPVPVGGLNRRRRAPNWVALAIAAAAVVLVVWLVDLLQPDGEAVPVPRVAQPATTATTRPPRVTGALPPATTAPAARGVSVVLRWTAPTWARVTVDGEVAFEGTLAPPARRPFSGRRRIRLVLGNAAGVDLTVNGSAVGAPGAAGEVWQGSYEPGDPVR